MTPSASRFRTRSPPPRQPDAGPAARLAALARLLLDAALALLLAPSCAACRAPLPHPTRGVVCAACWTSIVPIAPPICDGCGDPLRSWRVLTIARCARCRQPGRILGRMRAIGPYDGTLRAVIHALKYDGRRSVAAGLAALLERRGTAVLDGADLVVPVPLHRARQRRRGFNQAEAIARRLPLPMARALVRVRDTPSQTGLSAGARRANVRGAFRVVRPARVRGAVVVLVDDVSTTGATLEACARALVAGGAREVRALTAARVVPRAR